MNTRLADAAHLLALLAQHPGVPVPSDALAASLGTHPTHVRRLLGALAAAGITTVQRGAGGGALLARRADRITALDVWRALGAVDLFGPTDARTDAAEPADDGDAVARYGGAALAPVLAAATRAAERELARATIADLLREVGRYAARDARARPVAAPRAPS